MARPTSASRWKGGDGAGGPAAETGGCVGGSPPRPRVREHTPARPPPRRLAPGLPRAVLPDHAVVELERSEGASDQKERARQSRDIEPIDESRAVTPTKIVSIAMRASIVAC